MANRRGREDPLHPIGVVAERTGLSQDVLRAWERRYGITQPARSPGGQRLYSDADIERLRLLNQAILGGRSIGGIAHLTTSELVELVTGDEEARRQRPREQVSEEVAAADEHLERAFDLAAGMDGMALEALLRRSAASIGVVLFLERVAGPLLTKVGAAWHAGRITPAQEHLATVAVKRVVDAAAYNLPVAADAPTFLSCTPAGERHEVGALLAAASASVAGWRVIYLGPDLPAEEIAAAAARTRAGLVALSVVYAGNRSAVAGELRALRAALPASTYMVVGGEASLALEEELRGLGITFLRDLPALRAELSRVASRNGGATGG